MKKFPIMLDPHEKEGVYKDCPTFIPWDLIAPYNDQAQKNHSQTLERLAKRGGLHPREIFAIISGSNWGYILTLDDEKISKWIIEYIERNGEFPPTYRAKKEITYIFEHAKSYRNNQEIYRKDITELEKILAFVKNALKKVRELCQPR